MPSPSSPHNSADGLSIASLTIAYNGADSLPRHLASLQRQSRKIDEVIVVDNASTDATRHLLASHPEITVLPLTTNRGIAGGLATGLSYAALEKQYDWIWIFDQDSIPAENALAKMLDALSLLGEAEPQTAILAPTCLHTDAGVQYPALSWHGSSFRPVTPDAPIAFVDMVISSGTLLRREAILRAGLPREDFFIDFVDYEHCLRLRRHGFRIALVRDAILEHAIGSPESVRFLGREVSWADHAPWREYYMTRNEIFTISQYHPELGAKLFAFYRLSHHALGILFFGKQKLECFRMMWHGLVDGLSGKLGVRYLPHDSEQQPGPPETIPASLERGTP